ncbi:MarR family winged helix-turn-helix transcriptional regulator [Sphingomonas sp. DT-204]|uniref:MarR family winged helix-turn-helix transcriptional regulator n=1 Tax=Sphingomonas sp. DT-204 TaxID=3396166 RepID=UPI003F1AB9B6
MGDSGLGFLISDVSRLMRRRFDERARSFGATRAQWKTLALVSRHQGINQGGLAELLEVEPITLSRMLDRLEQSGLVERRRDPADRRAWRIHLTDAARPVIDQAHSCGAELMEAALLGVDARESAAVTATLQKIRDNLAQLDPDTTIEETAHG